MSSYKSGACCFGEIVPYDSNVSGGGVYKMAGSVETSVLHIVGKERNGLEQENMEYDAMQNLSQTVYPNGAVAAYTYNMQNLPEQITLPTGGTICFQYDRNGNRTEAVDPEGNRTVMEYDSRNRMVKKTDPMGAVTAYAYDSEGRCTQVTDAAGNVHEYEYDAAGQLVRETDVRGNITVFECITRYLFELSGKPETMIDPLGMKEQYEYDRSGRMTAKTDADGYTTRYAWNPVGDLCRITYADGRTAEFTYNSLRQLVRIDDWLGTARIEPDAAGHAKKVTDPMGREVSCEWGVLGERRKTVYPDGQSVSFEYDDLSRLIRLKDGKQEVRYCYDADGRLIEKQYPDEIRTGYQYSPMGRLKSLVHQKSGTVLERYEYEYDLLGNRTALRKERRASVFASVTERLAREESGNYTYRYDSLDRLTEVLKDGKLQSRYEYDAYGNRTEKETGEGTIHYFYNEADQLIREEGSDGERAFQYDKRGNLTAIRQGEEFLRQYLYDETSRMAAASDGIHSSWYQYSGVGNRTGILEYAVAPPGPGNLFLPEAVPAGVPSKRTEYITDQTIPQSSAENGDGRRKRGHPVLYMGYKRRIPSGRRMRQRLSAG